MVMKFLDRTRSLLGVSGEISALLVLRCLDWQKEVSHVVVVSRLDFSVSDVDLARCCWWHYWLGFKQCKAVA